MKIFQHLPKWVAMCLLGFGLTLLFAGSRPSTMRSFNDVDHRFIRYVDVIPAEDLPLIGEGLAASDGRQYPGREKAVKSIETNYLKVEIPFYPGNENEMKSIHKIYYVKFGLGVNIYMLLSAGACLLLAGVIFWWLNIRLQDRLLKLTAAAGLAGHPRI